MERTGVCSQCNRSGTLYTCSMCGGLVDSKCYDTNVNVCKKCSVRFTRK